MSNLEKAVELIGSYFAAHIPHNEANSGADEELAKALKDTGLLAPDLPEPAVISVNGSNVWREDNTLWVYAKPGEIGINVSPDIQAMYTPATARKQAYVLLAAANYAETEE